MDLQSTKILVAVLFGCIRFFFGTLPVKLYHVLRKWEEDDGTNTFINKERHAQVNCAIALFQSFGGGVLFATCFLHMMLEVYNSMEDLKRIGNISTDYPVSQLIICVGFFLIYFLEEVSHWLITRVPAEPYPVKKQINNYTNSSVTPLDSESIKKNSSAFIVEDEYEKEVYDEENEVKDFKEDEVSTEDTLDVDYNHEKIVYDSLSLNSEVLRQNAKNLEITQEAAEETEEAAQHLVKSQQQVMRAVLIVLALSFNAIFEGLAIGLHNNVSDIWYLFIAVSIHSATILFVIGLELLLAKVTTRYIIMLMLCLALASPLGIILGLLVTIKSDMETTAKSTAMVLLEGLSAGTILYITFFEILNREKERRVYRVYRGLCIIGGFCIMALLQYLELYR